MRKMWLVALAVLAAFAVIVVPAQAKREHHAHAKKEHRALVRRERRAARHERRAARHERRAARQERRAARHERRAQSRKCMPHNEAYTVRGTLVSGSLTKNANGTYSGTLVVDVKRANHHAKADTGTTQTYTLNDARVKLHGENPAALTANSRVTLIGRITALRKKCDQAGFTPTVTIKKADIKPPKTS